MHVHYVLGSANHALVFEQDGGSIVGTHVGERTSGDLRGQIEADQISFRSFHRWEASGFPYEFQGRVQGDSMSGEVQLGEYGSARWSAARSMARCRRRQNSQERNSRPIGVTKGNANARS